MIYLVSNTIQGASKLSVKESLELILSWPVVQFDTETTGLNPHICKLLSLQFGYKDFTTGECTQIVVDCLSINPEEYKEAIEKSYLIGHNLKFDLEFLFNHNIVPRRIYDTMICEQTLYLGYKPGKVSMKLGDVLQRYTGIELDKSFQKQISKKGLTVEGIQYAANDVVHLQDIRKHQMMLAKSRNCLVAFAIENRFVPAIAYLEWCGVHLDEQKWKAKMNTDKRDLLASIDKLNAFVKNNPTLNQMFSSPSLFDENTVSIDWGSPQQVVPVIQALGFNTKVLDKRTRKEKDSIEEDVLSNQKGINDEFLELYFNYKGLAKVVSSYGQGHLNLINPITNRLHTEFKQIGTVTGRMSSGGGDNEGSKGKIDLDLAVYKKLNPDKVRFVNLQNLPAKGEIGKITRACFTAEEGNLFVSCDYSAEESRVSADVWNEKSLLEAFEQGIDTHNLYAKMCFPEELKDVDVKDVKKKFPELRQAAKSAEFAVNYGSNGASIAAKIGMPREKAMEMVQGIIKGMPGMSAYKKKACKFLKNHGYIIISEITGHRVYWPEWAAWKAVEDSFDREFWNNYALFHKGTDDDVCKKVKEHKNKSHDWFEKNVLNYPIQGGSAIVLKQAAADLFDWVIDHGYFNIVKFCVFVHDELDCECPKKLAPEFSKAMESIMEKAAARFYKRLPIPATCDVETYWKH